MAVSSTSAAHQTMFDAKNYLQTRFNGEINDKESFMGFYLQSYHQFYTKFSTNWDNSTASLLEFGGGPAIYALISAAPHFHDITFAEFIPAARTEVELWRNNDPEAHNWTPYFKFVAHTLEGQDVVSEVIKTREQELRSKIKSIIQCDITSTTFLPGVSQCFDVIHSNFALECAFDSKDGYKTGIAKLKSLLKPGGYLAILITEERTFYVVNEKEFKTAYLTSEDIHSLLCELGFSVEMSCRKPIPQEALHIYRDCKAMEFVLAKRVD